MSSSQHRNRKSIPRSRLVSFLRCTAVARCSFAKKLSRSRLAFLVPTTTTQLWPRPILVVCAPRVLELIGNALLYPRQPQLVASSSQQLRSSSFSLAIGSALYASSFFGLSVGVVRARLGMGPRLARRRLPVLASGCHHRRYGSASSTLSSVIPLAFHSLLSGRVFLRHVLVAAAGLGVVLGECLTRTGWG